MRLYLVLVKLLVISALLIISNYNLALRDAENRAVFFESYYGWLSDTFDKGVYVTGYVVRSEWLPDTSPNKSVAWTNTLSPGQR